MCICVCIFTPYIYTNVYVYIFTYTYKCTYTDTYAFVYIVHFSYFCRNYSNYFGNAFQILYVSNLSSADEAFPHRHAHWRRAQKSDCDTQK